MKKIQIVFLLTICLLLCGCDSNTTFDSIQDAKHTQDSSDYFNADKDVRIVFTTSFYHDSTISNKEYVEEQLERNPYFYVYDEEHYGLIIKESTLLKELELYKNTDIINIAESFFQSEEYNGAYIHMKNDNMLQEVIYYVDKEKCDDYSSLDLFSPIISTARLADSVQAYNLVPIEERQCLIKFIDYKTNEIIYEYDAL